jgi:hypothetical protein
MSYDNDDMEYDDEYDKDSFDQKYKHYFKFDPDAWDAWGKLLYDTLNDVVEYSPNVWHVYGFPVNSYISNTGKDNKSFQYLGVNYDGVGIWKSEYFIYNKIFHDYIKHIQNHAAYFLKQPHYYKGLFDILN